MISATVDRSAAHIDRVPSILLRTTNVLGYVLLILVNIFANLGVLGPTNAEVSANYPTPLTPAGWAFSIWALIFLLQGCGVFYQAFLIGYADDGFKRSIINTIGEFDGYRSLHRSPLTSWLTAVAAAGYGWQIGWYMECLWQVFFVRQTPTAMVLCLLCLSGALAAFGITLWRLYAVLEERKQNISAGYYLLFLLPTSINTAWLSVATVLGLLIVPVAHDVPPHKLEPFAVVCAVLISCVGALILLHKRDAGYGLTLTWAFVAVFGAHMSPLIKYSSLSCTLVLLLLSMFVLTRRRSRLHEVDLHDDNDDDQQVLLASKPEASER